jgi:hypothetical protein
VYDLARQLPAGQRHDRRVKAPSTAGRVPAKPLLMNSRWKRVPSSSGGLTRHAYTLDIRQFIAWCTEDPRKLRYIGRQRNRAWFLIVGATYNLLRITALDTHTV